ncbi:acylphosphatase [Methanotrichaceae archaeon M04Ac]|uniref:acylphosphatase n=1 Tax=Candidatus Methanocrinis alkalitolerans TaxID=3033395 RepID=A0ABT5XHJ6_9EURY|nr:acylphosphatase [Candidatus Methanocrinis alkalitolerans]MCR3884672.1 acylphosphatase [Methanothrix sp.]MDF0594161.1 acylphosphatase [Candidatus Methanocrinis alkalitolerans]
MICIRVRVSGRVQGVGYRRFVTIHAKELEVAGRVQNLPGGGVEALLQGERKNVGELLNQMKTGPAQALVSGMDISEVECQKIDDFKVVY